LYEGATENTTACKGLLADLERRGMRTDRSLLVVIDGSKALRAAVEAVFGERAIVQRCQVHSNPSTNGVGAGACEGQQEMRWG
jgi:transposase-like protein